MAAFKYEFSGGSGFRKIDAQTVGEICEELENSGTGLSPRSLLDASRDENAPLHGCFTWDDTEAAEKWRLEEARLLIANIRIVKSTDTEERERVRGFVSTPGRQSVYVSMNTALHREELRNYMLEQSRRDCEAFMAKYRTLTELANVIDAMKEYLS